MTIATMTRPQISSRTVTDEMDIRPSRIECSKLQYKLDPHGPVRVRMGDHPPSLEIHLDLRKALALALDQAGQAYIREQELKAQKEAEAAKWRDHPRPSKSPSPTGRRRRSLTKRPKSPVPKPNPKPTEEFHAPDWEQMKEHLEQEQDNWDILNHNSGTWRSSSTALLTYPTTLESYDLRNVSDQLGISFQQLKWEIMSFPGLLVYEFDGRGNWCGFPALGVFLLRCRGLIHRIYGPGHPVGDVVMEGLNLIQDEFFIKLAWKREVESDVWFTATKVLVGWHSAIAAGYWYY
ncbi:hypothetical protein BJ508DRAFT_13346 [Ascobolus immersus RN42]|uniref:Uncharacterized protein n=1 Tax=Ascobolus immersus RN42 TaxID=1160509 RepID=A0A3N4IG37_ASCIM|nr:hypothetical protein BJ508DRAFT_13346 [Ascobolus immersus RN42]